MRSVRSRPKSQRQYVFNSAALDLVRKLPAAKPAPIPKYVEPLFATLWEHPPKGENWVHEIKFDGYRLQLPGTIIASKRTRGAAMTGAIGFPRSSPRSPTSKHKA
jgi:ATP-dependent DNA ligase